MPRFHFHLIDGDRILDSVGRLLTDQEEAQREAKRIAKYQAVLHQRWHYVEVTNEAGERVLRVSVNDETSKS